MVSFSEVIDFVDVIIWPLVILIAIGLAITDRGQRFLRPILRRIRKVSGGGFALELSSEAAAATKVDVEGAITDFSKPLADEFERIAYAKKIRECLADAVAELLTDHQCPKACEHRATVYVSDALYRDALYQLVDYWPGGDGSGRRFSMRFGILGTAWRLGESLYRGRIPSDSPQKLIRGWGMTREQAEGAGRGRQSFFCGVLRDRGALVGVLYMDAKTENAFPKDIVKRFRESRSAPNLGARVGEVHRHIADLGPAIRVLQSD
jgi:hypothetical protein